MGQRIILGFHLIMGQLESGQIRKNLNSKKENVSLCELKTMFNKVYALKRQSVSTRCLHYLPLKNLFQ